MKQRTLYAILIALIAVSPTRVSAQNLDTVHAGRFDYGKMWTFEYPPTSYFTQTYGFDANAQWFEKARLASVRINGCSASFVSPYGLIVTNHHCARDYVFNVSKPGENLLDNGFFAKSLDAERPVKGFFVDQLVAVEDVSAEIFSATDKGTTDQERNTLRNAAATRIRQRMMAARNNDSTYIYQIIALYNGGRYSAYTFKRYTNVKLVAAPELQMGFFGGDPDNFTYPRYALDFSFLRVYDDKGQPLSTPNYFNWSTTGVKEGDAVFVIGSPGPTNRLQTVAQLEYQRDVSVPAAIRALRERMDAMHAFYAEDPALGEKLDIRNRAFSLSNSLKAYIGRLDALQNPVIMARKADAEKQLRIAMAAKPELQSRYGSVLDQIAKLQQDRRELATSVGAFTLLGSAGNPGYESALIVRALTILSHLDELNGTNADSVKAVRARMLAIPDQPPSLERKFLTARLADLQYYLPASSPIVASGIGNRTIAQAVDRLLNESALATNEKLEAAITAGKLTASDPALQLAAAMTPLLDEYRRTATRLAISESDLGSQLGRVRFEINGTDVPPDASSSPRITDGIVKGYEYNGTLAPAFTTFYGLYDRHYSFPTVADWALPKRWLPAPPKLDLNTPLDFVSTADTYGGNSGSPTVTRDLSLVGLNFDRNINGLSRDFIYLPEAGRNVMVDVRAVREALDDVYDLDRIVQELLTHKLYRTEAAADRALADQASERRSRLK
jgi:hypothetical protein